MPAKPMLPNAATTNTATPTAVARNILSLTYKYRTEWVTCKIWKDGENYWLQTTNKIKEATQIDKEYYNYLLEEILRHPTVEILSITEQL